MPYNPVLVPVLVNDEVGEVVAVEDGDVVAELVALLVGLDVPVAVAVMVAVLEAELVSDPVAVVVIDAV